ncbi:MAG: hypothetical protein KBI01_09010 [Oscillospiraceae bacterium]|nr:hypothetical protein [Oscillospiraceae bacterium]
MADLIYQPNDDFYNSHTSDCEYLNRDYYANGESGYIELFTEPYGSSLGFADNGGVFHVQFTYKKGDVSWGVVEYMENGDKLIPKTNEGSYKAAWINMKDTVLKYDYQSFDAEHSAEYTQYNGDYSELSSKQNIVSWTFPNSGDNTGAFESIDDNFVITSVYTDINGNKWGFVGYYYAVKNFWICISDPTNAEIAPDGVEAPALYSPEPGSEPVSSENDMTTVFVVCVAVVVLIAVVLTAVFNKKKEKDTETN